MQQKILEIKNLSKNYGEIAALANFSLDLEKGEVLGHGRPIQVEIPPPGRVVRHDGEPTQDARHDGPRIRQDYGSDAAVSMFP